MMDHHPFFPIYLVDCYRRITNIFLLLSISIYTIEGGRRRMNTKKKVGGGKKKKTRTGSHLIMHSSENRH